MPSLSLTCGPTLSGVMRARRAGTVVMANALGSAFLESPAIQGFLPGIAQHLTGEELSLPALPTWWCGEQAALQEVLPELAHSVIRPTWPMAQRAPVLGGALSPQALKEWSQRIEAQAPMAVVATRLNVLKAIETQLKGLGLTMGDVVKMQVFLVGDPAMEGRMDFGGFMKGYSEFFGTAAQPNLPVRSTMQVAALANPGFLVEIEVTAVRP